MYHMASRLACSLAKQRFPGQQLLLEPLKHLLGDGILSLLSISVAARGAHTLRDPSIVSKDWTTSPSFAVLLDKILRNTVVHLTGEKGDSLADQGGAARGTAGLGRRSGRRNASVRVVLFSFDSRAGG